MDIIGYITRTVVSSYFLSSTFNITFTPIIAPIWTVFHSIGYRLKVRLGHFMNIVSIPPGIGIIRT